MKNRIIILSMLSMAVMFAFQSCGKYPGFKKNESGFYVKYHETNKEGAQLAAEKIATLNIRYHTEIDGKDSVMFESSKQPRAFELVLTAPQYKGDIYEALATLREGDSVTFMINAKDFLMKTAGFPELPKGIDSTSWMYFDIGVIKVQTREEMEKAMKEKNKVQEAEESKQLQEYLTKNNITTAPQPSGLIYIETAKGTGPQAVAGKMVKVKYAGRLLNGTEFDSSEKHGGDPYEFPLGQSKVIKGWDEGIALMKKGGKATLIIPSNMAYGPQDKGMIPPFSTLVFDVELVDVK